MNEIHWVADAVYLIDLLIRVGLSVRIIMRRLPVGVALAWLSVVLIFPYAGAVLYLLIGESRLGRDRRRRAKALRESYRGWSKLAGAGDRAVADLSPCSRGLARLAETLLDSPPLPGNDVHLLHDAGEAFPALLGDIDAARHSCHLEFYIWDVGGKADAVVEALLRAAARGVTCRVLVDAIGSKTFLRSDLARRLRQGGVALREALPVTLRRLLFVRADLRLHRKIVVIDGAIAYTGSLNLADPALFKRNAGVGQWVDAFARVRGPAVAALGATFRYDWELETGEALPGPAAAEGPPAAPEGSRAVVQVLPSGPGERVGAIGQVLLAAVYAAERELVLTTPYFVPDESLMAALLSAPGRGVDVTLIVPARVDSRMTHYASRAYQADLLAAGVRIALYQGGLLHTKSLAADGQFSLFGSLNLDPRSLRLDFEVTLAVYDAQFTAALRGLQQTYLGRCEWLDLGACRSRSAVERFTEDAARLVGPLL